MRSMCGRLSGVRKGASASTEASKEARQKLKRRGGRKSVGWAGVREGAERVGKAVQRSGKYPVESRLCFCMNWTEWSAGC